MTKRKEKAWLEDILESVEKIEQHPQYKRGRLGFDEDSYYRDVIYLHIERICEASKHLCEEHNYDKQHPGIPWREIIGTRIILAHCYWNIEDDIIWNIVEINLPTLKQKVVRILKTVDLQ